MPRYLKIVLWVFLGVVLTLGLCGVLAATFNWNHAKPWINQQASEIAGRPVAVEGDLSVKWTRSQGGDGWRAWVPWPQLHAEQITIGNPSWSNLGPHMTEIKSVSMLLNPVALLDKTIQITSLEIADANLALERQDDGQNNWTFKKDENAKPSEWKFELQKVALKNVTVQAVDTGSKLDLKADVNSLDSATEKGYGIGWKAGGSYNDATISGSGQMGDVLTLRQGGKPFPLQGDVKVGETVIAIEGSVTRPQSLAALDVRLKMAGDTMADLFPLIGVALPNTPAYSTEGHLIGMLEGDDDTWRYEGFKGVVGESDLYGTLEFHVRKPRSLLTGAVESKLLRLKDLGPLIGADTSDAKGSGKQKPKVKPPAGKTLPVDPISTKAWAAMDADVKFKGLKILREKELPLDNIEAQIKLQDRVLSFTPLNFGIAGGTLSNTITLDGRNEKIKANVATTARHLKLKRLLPGAESMQESFGELHGDAKLSGQGNSVAELLAHANGEIKALVSQGTISQFLLEAAGLNVANMVMAKLFGDEQIVLKCLASDFKVTNGVMEARAFKLETADAIVDITGQVNLSTERFDMDIIPENKTLRIFTLRSPLYIKGTFKNPDVGVHKGPLTARAGAAIVLGAVATPLAALLPLLNLGTNDTNECGPLVAAVNKPPKAPAPGEADKPAAAPATQESAGKNGRAAAKNAPQEKRPAGSKDEANWPSSKNLP